VLIIYLVIQLALKFPCDLIVETTKEGKWFFNRPSDLISVESHDYTSIRRFWSFKRLHSFKI
jgi:hypothetical protein